MPVSDRKWKKPELLAPAGDLYRARLAIAYGADAVYLGGMKYSLRARASNFKEEDIQAVCRYASEHCARVHVTVNVIPHEEDFAGLISYLKHLEAYGVTAIITASPAIMMLARKHAPGLQVHCSTQMSTTNSTAASFLHEKLGITRVVLARECTLDEIAAFTMHCPIETEAFIHGGMCINYSGRCTLSNRMTSRDANRGGCAQSCRWQYDLYRDDEKLTDETCPFTMGSKDMMAAREISTLMKYGVDSLKIEGRMKSEYYVASVVSGYRHLIDAVYEKQDDLTEEEIRPYIREIMKGENREVAPGNYHGDAGKNGIIYHENSNSHVNHDFLAMVESYDPEHHEMTVITRNPFDQGERVEVLRQKGKIVPFVIEQMTDENGFHLETSRSPMKRLRVNVPCEVSRNDILRKVSDDTD
jgi:putative protease